MRIDCALLCDAVTERNGLLNILGGGITRMGRPGFPSTLGAGLALRVMCHPTEVGPKHEIDARLLREDGEQVGTVTIGFALAQSSALRPGEEYSIAVALPLQSVALPAAGAYSFEILIDGIHQASVPFVADDSSARSDNPS